MSELPSGWTKTTLGEVCAPPEYGWTTSATDNPGKVKLLRATDISRGQVDWNTVPWCSEEPANVERYAVKENDLLITRTGAGVGRAFLIGECPLAAFASYLIRFTPKHEVSPRYLAYFLNSPDYWAAISVGAAGIAQPNVNATKLSAIELPIAPRGEQDRIVDEIEKQFTRLDAATAALKRVQANLKRYRASVLKAACEGRLVPTEAELARKEGRDYEPADQLLQRILRERRARWEADTLAKMIASGKAPKDDRWKQTYKVPLAPDKPNLADLPEGWCWITLDQIGQIGTGATPNRSRREYWSSSDFPWVTSAVVNEDYVDEAKEAVSRRALAETNLTLYLPGTLLIAMYGEGKTRGKVTELRIPATTNQALAAISIDGLAAECRPFVKLALQSMYESIRSGASGGVQPNLNLSSVRNLTVALPPSGEQARITQAAERVLSISASVGSLVRHQQIRGAGIRASVLREAFSGRLCPQSPVDEPASSLLERLRAEYSAKQASSRSRRKEEPAYA